MKTTEDGIAKPTGELALQTLAMPKDTNANGDIFGGWLVSQMDLGAGIASKKVSRGRSATVAIKDVNFIIPVSVGATVSCYTEVVHTGRTSIQIKVEVWMSEISIEEHSKKGRHRIPSVYDADGPGRYPREW